jgi:predicted XRE-type DNA-binding protein
MAPRPKAVKKTKKPSVRSSIRRSSGNVFVDLGFDKETAEHLRIRSALMATVRRVIDDAEMTQSEAAKLFNVTQPRISNLMRGKIDLFSVDTLIEMLSRAGVGIEVWTTTPKRTKVA